MKPLIQSEALNILRFTERKEWDTDGTFALRYLMRLNDYCKAICGYRLYNIFEIIGVNQDNAQVVLSYTISNIKILSKERMEITQNQGKVK